MWSRSDLVRHISTVGAGVGIAIALVLLSISAARAASPRGVPVARAVAASVPTLGVASIARNGSGFGQVKPRTISYGGDPTSLVSNVTWSSWGPVRAIGHGSADWVWPGWCVACGSVELPATVVAFGRTTCQGHSAYSHVEWYFPSRGMSFNRQLGNNNICGEGGTPTAVGKELKCGLVSLLSHGAVVAIADNVNMYDSPISCATARRFVVSSGAARYLDRSARFTAHGWWCGSELSMDLGGLQSFTCVQGDFTNVTFNLYRAGD